MLRREGGRQPQWIPDRLLGFYGYLSYDTSVTRPHANGSNMAYRRRLLLEFGGFRTDLGRQGDQRLSGEESDLQWRLRQAGYKITYAPGAVVEHWVPASHQTHRFLIKAFYDFGVTESVRRRGHGSRDITEIAKRCLRSLLLIPCSIAALTVDLNTYRANWVHLLLMSESIVLSQIGFIITECRKLIRGDDKS